MSNKIKDAILNELEVPMNQIAERIINQEKALFLKKTGKEMIISKWAEEMIRLSLVIDLMKTLQNYVKPTDELENMKWCEGGKGIEISANILREGVSYNFFTEAIYAGGYNIQRLHLRYITKTKMPRIISDLAKEYQEKYKNLNKIEKLEKEIESYQLRIAKYQTRIDYLTPMTQYAYPPYKEELLVELGKHPMYGWRVNKQYKWEDIDQTYYKKGKEEWEMEQQQLIIEGMISMIEREVNQPKRYIQDYKKKIVKMTIKIDNLTIS
tara:strand:+ start:941 stop:1741 length:801 start_codon:yes stop_codon:yes gene_type:complete